MQVLFARYISSFILRLSPTHLDLTMLILATLSLFVPSNVCRASNSHQTEYIEDHDSTYFDDVEDCNRVLQYYNHPEDYAVADTEEWQTWNSSQHDSIDESSGYQDIPYHGWHDWQTWGPQGDPYQPRRDVIYEASSSSISDSRDRRRGQTDAIGHMSRSFDASLTIKKEDKKTSLLSEIMNRKPAVDACSSHFSKSSSANQASGTDDSHRESLRAQSVQDESDSDFSIDSDSADLDDCDTLQSNVSKTQADKQRQDKIRREFDAAFRDNGLSYQMNAQKLALGITKVKIELGFNKSLGQIASNRVKENVSKEVFDTFQILNIKYTRRLSQLKKDLDATQPYSSEQEKWQIIYKKVDEFNIRSYGGRKNRDKRSIEADRSLDQKAAATWCLIVERFPIRLQRLAAIHPEMISTIDIEKYSRELRYDDDTQNTTAGYVKRYMRRILGRDKTELLQFSALRYRFRLQERVLDRAQKMNQRRAEKGLPPIGREGSIE